LEPIVVPAPPKSAFNKQRRISDLLLGQLRHFQHVEEKNGIHIDPALARDIHTEAGAARYIAEITRSIRAQSPAAQPSGIALVPGRAATPPEAPGLSIAAAAASHAAAPTSAPDPAPAREKP
jgi:hypothetical protein